MLAVANGPNSRIPLEPFPEMTFFNGKAGPPITLAAALAIKTPLLALPIAVVPVMSAPIRLPKNTLPERRTK